MRRFLWDCNSGDASYQLSNSLFLTRLKHRQLWLMLIILPTWINLLLKAYAFIGIFGQNGSINQFLGIYPNRFSAVAIYRFLIYSLLASYIELPFMILPIFNVLDDMDNNLINASYDLGATRVGKPSVMSSSLCL